MMDEAEYVGALDIIVESRRAQRGTDEALAERAEEARRLVDEGRLALADLVAPAVAVIYGRLMGQVVDWDGRPLTEEREKTALNVLDRVGIPKLRATAISASIAHAPTSPAPGGPGFLPPAGDGEETAELDPASVDAQISAFLEGARVARDLRGERED